MADDPSKPINCTLKDQCPYPDCDCEIYMDLDFSAVELRCLAAMADGTLKPDEPVPGVLKRDYGQFIVHGTITGRIPHDRVNQSNDPKRRP